MKSKNTFNRMLAQYLHSTRLPITLFWMSSALLMPQMASAEEEVFYPEAIEEPAEVQEVVAQPVPEPAKPSVVQETVKPSVQQDNAATAHKPPVATTPEATTAVKPPVATAAPTMKSEGCSVGCDQKPSDYCAPPLKARVTCCPDEKKDECGKVIPHQKSCCCCNCYNATAPLESIGFMVDLIYFKPIEDSLTYAVTNSFTMGPPTSPAGKLVEQEFAYRPGARVGVLIPLDYDEWEFDINYTYFHSNAPTTTASDPGQFLFTTLTNSYWPLANNALNNQCGHLTGNWKLKMDFVDFEFKRPFLVGKALMISPVLGIKASLVRQHVRVEYGNIFPNYYGIGTPILAPQTVVGKSKVWGVGPEFAAEMKLLVPRKVSLFMRGAFSCMFGQFNMTTKYTDFLAYSSTGGSTPVLTIGGQTGSNIIQDKITRLFCVAQLQGAVSKWWMLGRCSSLELMLGWETQIWWRQMRMNWFSTLANQPDGSDLTLQGPFARMTLTF